jgi:hypothetical protein
VSSETDAADEQSDESSTAGYVHDPAAYDEDGERRSQSEPGDNGPVHPTSADREFDWRGWTLVGVVVFAFVVAPLVVYVRPPQLPWWVALVVFPLLPAILLGATAVWATTRP